MARLRKQSIETLFPLVKETKWPVIDAPVDVQFGAMYDVRGLLSCERSIKILDSYLRGCHKPLLHCDSDAVQDVVAMGLN